MNRIIENLWVIFLNIRWERKLIFTHTQSTRTIATDSHVCMSFISAVGFWFLFMSCLGYYEKGLTKRSSIQSEGGAIHVQITASLARSKIESQVDHPKCNLMQIDRRRSVETSSKVIEDHTDKANTIHGRILDLLIASESASDLAWTRLRVCSSPIDPELLRRCHPFLKLKPIENGSNNLCIVCKPFIYKRKIQPYVITGTDCTWTKLRNPSRITNLSGSCLSSSSKT